MKKRTYILQELQIVGHHLYWLVLTRSDDLDYVIGLKKLYSSRYKDNMYQVCEVIDNV